MKVSAHSSLSGRINIAIGSKKLSKRDQLFLKDVENIIKRNISNEDFDVNDLAKSVFFSVSQLNRRLNKLMNCSAGMLIRNIRLEYAAQLLAQKKATINQIAFEIGYRNQANFCRSFKQQYGYAPSEHNRKLSH